MTPAYEAGLIAGIEKVAYRYASGQVSSSYSQPPPAQTPDDHRRRTRNKVLAIGAGLAALGAGVAGRKHIARGARGVVGRLRDARDIKNISKAKSWEELGHAKARSSTLDDLGKVPTGKMHHEVAQDFRSMGIDPPPAHPIPGHPKSRGRWKAKALAGAVGVTAVGAGLAHGASKTLSQRVRREEDDDTPGMRGVGR